MQKHNCCERTRTCTCMHILHCTDQHQLRAGLPLARRFQVLAAENIPQRREQISLGKLFKGPDLSYPTLGLAILDPTYRSRSIGLALVGMVGGTYIGPAVSSLRPSIIALIVAQKFHLNPLQACVRKVLGDELKVRQPPGELHRLTRTRESHLQRDYIAPTT